MEELIPFLSCDRSLRKPSRMKFSLGGERSGVYKRSRSLVSSSSEHDSRPGVYKRSRDDVTSSSEHDSLSESEYSLPFEEEPIMTPATRRVTEGNRGIINQHPRPISATLLDPEILDCSICFDPLTTPIFQCDNGHIACSTCCTRMKNKCPSCSLPIGYNRNRAMEKVVESVRIACKNAKYGCTAMVTYNSKLIHEDNCIYVPCECPFGSCSFIGSSVEVYHHVPREHKKNDIDGYRAISYDTSTLVSCLLTERAVILRNETDAVIFVLMNHYRGGGRKVALTRIGSPDSEEFSYEIVMKSGRDCLRFESTTESIRKLADWSPLQSYVLIPHSYFFPAVHFELEICISR